MPSTIRLNLRQQRSAMRLLRQTVGALADELHAAGPDEIAYHPILQEHAKIHNRVWRFLERFEGVR